MSRGLEDEVDGETELRDMMNFSSKEGDGEANENYIYDPNVPVAVKDEDSVKLFIGQVRACHFIKLLGLVLIFGFIGIQKDTEGYG